MPNRIRPAAATSSALLSSRNDSRETGAKPPSLCRLGARIAYSVNDPTIKNSSKPSTNRPRDGSAANECTETSTPERTKKVPSKLRLNAKMASSRVQLRNRPRFSVTASEWINAVEANHGMNEAFSTGSQNHQPPQPST